jgi:TonB family protein
MPGLGQMCGGEKRKGMLFLTAHVINVSILLIIVFSPLILKGLDTFGHAYGMKINEQLSQSFVDLGIGSPSSVILGLLLLAFATFAARDAFDHGTRKRREAIYHDYVLAMPEAASGSYIFHISLLLTCLVLAFFFLIPPAPHTQVTDIEFLENEQNTKEKVLTKDLAVHSSKAAGKRDPNRPLEQASAKPSSSQQTSAKTNKSADTKTKEPSQAKEPARVDQPKKAAEPEKTTEQQKTVEAKKPVAPVEKTTNFTPRPTLPALAQNPLNALPKPALPAPAAAAPRPTLPAISPTSASVPSPMQTLNLPRPAVSSFSTAVPMPVSPTKIAMGTGQPAMPRLPGKGVAADSPGGPAPIAVTTDQKGGTTGGADSPLPVPVKGGRSGGPSGANQGESAPGPRGVKPGPKFDQAGGPPGAMATPHLVSGPGTGSNNNPKDGPREGNSPEVGGEANWPPYMADLQRRIKRCWFPPHSETKRVKVLFTVTTDGELRNLRLITSSGLQIVDRAALKAVEDAAPFRHLPEHAPSSVDIEFTFDYNVFTGGSMH